MTSTPLNHYSFEDIEKRVRPFIQEGSLRKPDQAVQELIDWIRRPSPGRQLSFIEVLSLARKYGETPVEKASIVPWAETAHSMTSQDDNVYRLEGQCPICGAEHSLVRLYFRAPQCASLRDLHGYLYLCDHCKNQIYLMQTTSDGRVDKSKQKSFGKKLEDLNLSVRVYNCLKASNIESIGELTEWSRTDLKKIRGFGSKCVAELEEELARLGLRLKES